MRKRKGKTQNRWEYVSSPVAKRDLRETATPSTVGEAGSVTNDGWRDSDYEVNRHRRDKTLKWKWIDSRNGTSYETQFSSQKNERERDRDWRIVIAIGFRSESVYELSYEEHTHIVSLSLSLSWWKIRREIRRRRVKKNEVKTPGSASANNKL